MIRSTKKILLAFLAITLVAPVLFFGSARTVQALVPTATTIDIPKLLLENIPNIILWGLENAAYSGLKSLSHKLSESSANALFEELATGEKGKLPTFEPLTWAFYAIDAAESAVGGAMDGLAMGADYLIKFNEDRPDAIARDVKDLQFNKDQIQKGQLNLIKYQDQLSSQYGADNCESLIRNSKPKTKDDAETKKVEQCVKTRQTIMTTRDLISKNKTRLAETNTSLDNVSAQLNQYNASQNERVFKYTKDKAGAFSPGTLSFLKGVCNPSAGLLFRIGLGLSAGIGNVEEPVCKFKDLRQNWDRFIRNTGVAVGDLTSGENNWQLLADALDPSKSDVGVAFGIQSSILQDQIDEATQKQMERFETMIQGGVKPVTDFAGNILSPGGITKAMSDNIMDKFPADNKLTGKLLVDTLDIIADFVQTFVGKSSKLVFTGIRRLADEANQVGVALPGEEFNPTAVQSAQLYNPSAAPSYGGVNSATSRNIAQLVKVKTTSGQMIQTLSELQIQDCNVSPNACTIGSAFARAVQERMTVGQAMKEYRESGGSTGLNPDGRFGFKNKIDPTKPAEEPNDYQNDYPYRSMVILRKYRVLPVAWELSALYIRDNPDKCGKKDCTLKDLVDNYDNSGSPFFRLIDPSWVLKLPPVRCDLKGYGPTALETTQEPGAEPKERIVEAICMTDTNGDGYIWCGDGPAPAKKNDNSDIDKDLKIKPSPRAEICVDEVSCLSDGPDGKCAEKSAGFGYCIEEWKKFSLEGTACEPQFASCDTFTEATPSGAGESFVLKKESISSVYGDATSTAANVCKEENAGCSWLSSERRQYETCIIDIERDGEGNPKANGKKVLMENKTGEVLDNDITDDAGKVVKSKIDESKLNLCQKVIEKIDKNKTKTITRPWLDSEAKRTYLTYNAERCEESSDGCRAVTDVTGGGSRSASLKVAPPYLECDEREAFQRGECQRYALHCTQDTIGCQLYKAQDENDPDVPALYPASCTEDCVGIQSYFLQPSFFDPAPTRTFTFFKEGAVDRCSSAEDGCEEFTNVDLEKRGGEARAHFSKPIACELVENPENRTVFYSYYGSEQGGRQPVAFYLKADGSRNPACAKGDTSCVCNADTFASEVSLKKFPLTCREFINAAGNVSYRYVDKLVYQTNDCSEYRRSTDSSTFFASKSLSTQCSSAAIGCRAYSSTTAGNYELALRDTFEREPFPAGWGAPQGRTDVSVDTSREAETVGGRSLRIRPASGVATSGNLEAVKQIKLDSTKNYQLTLSAKSSGTPTLAIIGQEGTSSTATFVTAGWQYFTFNFENATSSTLTLRFTPVSGATLSQVFVDSLYLKESSGATIYAIDTSTKSERARPNACRINGSEMYLTTCRLYTTPNDDTPKAYSNFSKVCPLPFVGCRQFSMTTSGTNQTLYLVDAPSGQCAAKDINCTAYGLPRQTREYRTINSSGTVAVTMGVASSTTANDGYKEEWEQVFYKITPENISASSTLLYDDTVANDAVVYKAGICKKEEIGCKAYNTPSAKRYFKSPEKNLCFWTTGDVLVEKLSQPVDLSNLTEAQKKQKEEERKKAKQSQAQTVTKKQTGWFYKACKKKSGDLLDDMKNQENELYYPSYACQTDEDCKGLNETVYTGTCDALISCDAVDAAGLGGGPAAYAHAFEQYNARTGNLDASTPTTTYWNQSGPAAYLQACPSSAAGCRTYRDPECIPCGPGNPRCASPDPSKGTLRSDYGRLDIAKGMSGASCKPYQTYLGDVKTTQQECAGELNIENGCVLFQDEDPDGGAALYESGTYYNDYFKTKRSVTLNAADARNSAATAKKDANILLKAKLDRECKTSLTCASEIVDKDNPSRKICTERVPCIKRDANGGCIGIALPPLGVCKGQALTNRCLSVEDCQGADRACIPLGVCRQDGKVRCTVDSHCSSVGGTCITNPIQGDLEPYCHGMDGNENDCKRDSDCYWNTEVQGQKCQPAPRASLAGNFRTPYKQKVEDDLTPDTYYRIDLAFAGLSGYAHPSLTFNDQSGATFTTPGGRDSYFLTWSEKFSELSSRVVAGDPTGQLQNTLNVAGTTIANSCRLYPRSDSPLIRQTVSNPAKNIWNDACNYISGTAEKFVGVYGYCLEPYPQWKNKYEKEKIAKVCAKNIDKDCTNNTSACAADEGPCIYKGYSQACLLWNPITLANQRTSSFAIASLEQEINAYGDNDKKDIYFCIDKETTAETSQEFGYNKTQGSLNVNEDKAHFLYENYAGAYGNSQYDRCNPANATCDKWTRDSSSLKSGQEYVADLNKGDARTALENPERFTIVTEKPEGILDKLGKAFILGVNGCVGVGTIGAIGGSVVPGIGTAAGTAGGCATGAVGGAVAGLFSNQKDETWGVVSLNDPEKVNDRLSLDAIERIEYRIDASSRNRFRWLFGGGGDGCRGGECFQDCPSDKGGYCKRAYVLFDSGMGPKTSSFNTLYNAGGPGGAVGFWFEENGDFITGPTVRPKYGSLYGVRADDVLNSQNITCEWPGSTRDFVAMGPVVENNMIKGWRWRFCDKEGSWDGEAVAVSIRIIYKPFKTTLHHMAQDEITSYCKAFIKPVGGNGESVGLRNTVSAQGSQNTEPAKIGRSNLTYFTLADKKFIIGSLVDRISFAAKRYLWDRDEFFTEKPASSCQLKLKCYEPHIEKAVWDTRQRLNQDTVTFDQPDDYNDSSKTPDQSGISAYPDLDYYDDNNTESFRTSLFGKAYELWKWEKITGRVCVKNYSKSCGSDGDCSVADGGVCDVAPPLAGKYTKTAWWDDTQAKFVGADATILQEDMWDKSRTAAQGQPPVTHPAEEFTATDGKVKYRKTSVGAFGFTHDPLLYPKVRIRFWLDVPNDDHLPLRKVIIDWGDGSRRRLKYLDEDIEGKGRNERVGPAVGAETTDLPFEFSHFYADGDPNGKRICLYTMDNWEAKAAGCGTIHRDDASGNWEMTGWQYKHTAADFPLSPDASRSWPAATETY